MEKFTRHYNLDEIKEQFSDPDNIAHLTASAHRGARELMLGDDDIVAVIQGLDIHDFHKSVRHDRNHKIWMDVYLPTYRGIKLYVKFTRNSEDKFYLLISFKESGRQ